MLFAGSSDVTRKFLTKYVRLPIPNFLAPLSHVNKNHRIYAWTTKSKKVYVNDYATKGDCQTIPFRSKISLTFVDFQLLHNFKTTDNYNFTLLIFWDFTPFQLRMNFCLKCSWLTQKSFNLWKYPNYTLTSVLSKCTNFSFNSTKRNERSPKTSAIILSFVILQLKQNLHPLWINFNILRNPIFEPWQISTQLKSKFWRLKKTIKS